MPKITIIKIIHFTIDFLLAGFLFGELIIQYFIYNVSHLDVSGEKTCVRCVKGG